MRWVAATRRVAALLLVFVAIALAAAAERPVIKHIFPLGVQPGQPARLDVTGENLSETTELWTTLPSASTHRADTNSEANKEVIFELNLPSSQRPGFGALQLATRAGISDLQWILVDPIPAAVNVETNSTVSTAQRITRPLAVDGLAAEVTSHFFQIHVPENDHLSVEVIAARLGSSMDPLLRIVDAAGRELAYCEDFPGLGADARIDFTAPREGDYVIELRDSRYQGGPRHFYRMRVVDKPQPEGWFIAGSSSGVRPFEGSRVDSQPEHEPNDSLATAQPVTVPCLLAGEFGKRQDRDYYSFAAEKDQRFIVNGRTRSLGSACDLFLQLLKPDGSLVAESNPTAADEGSITNKFAETGTYLLLVEELNQQWGTGFHYQVDLRPFEAGFALMAETNKLEIPSGGTVDLKITATRRDYDGPISLAVSQSDLMITNNLIPARTNATQIKLSVPSNWSPGRLIHFYVTGQGTHGGKPLSSQASTLPALRKLFPNQLYPPTDLDGLISLGVTPSKPPAKPKQHKADGT